MAIEITAEDLMRFIAMDPTAPPSRDYDYWIGNDLAAQIKGYYDTYIHFKKDPMSVGIIRRWRFEKQDRSKDRTYIVLGEKRSERNPDSKFFLRPFRLHRTFAESDGRAVDKLYRDTFNLRFEVPPPDLRERVIETFSPHQPWLRSHLEWMASQQLPQS